MMKWVVLLAVVGIAWMVWTSNRRRDAAARAAPPPQARTQPPGTPSLPQDMVRCPVCALHLPRPEAQVGRSGRLYCSAEHRASGGD